MMRTPICLRLGIAHPIFGFSHSVDVCVAIAQAGGFPVLGLARELPHEIPPEWPAAHESILGERGFPPSAYHSSNALGAR